MKSVLGASVNVEPGSFRIDSTLEDFGSLTKE